MHAVLLICSALLVRIWTRGSKSTFTVRKFEKNQSMRRGFRIWRWAMASPLRFRVFGAVGRLAAKVVGGIPSLARHAGPLAGWTDGRTVPRPPERSFRAGKVARRLRLEEEERNP